MKSIMHNKKDGTCYLCMLLNRDDSQKHTQEHHAIYGNAKRKLSEKYGLKVYLCLEHHTAGKQAVHFNKINSMYIKKAAQKAFEDKYPDLDFKKIFGKNYLEETDRQQSLEEMEGFHFIGEQI